MQPDIDPNIEDENKEEGGGELPTGVEEPPAKEETKEVKTKTTKRIHNYRHIIKRGNNRSSM